MRISSADGCFAALLGAAVSGLSKIPAACRRALIYSDKSAGASAGGCAEGAGFATSFAGIGVLSLGCSAAFGLVCGRVDGAGAGRGNAFVVGLGSSAVFGFSGCGGGGLGAEAGIELSALSSSCKSMKLAAIGGGVWFERPRK